jgi:hypothetical protein
MSGSARGVIDWLLEEGQPSVRYRTLLGVVGRGADSREVTEARSKIGERGWARAILDHQLEGGYWHNYVFLNWPKYVSTAYITMMLVDLGLTAQNPKVKMGLDRLLKKVSEPGDGGFGFGRSGHFCWTGNFARTFINAGYGDDARVRRALDWIVDAQKEDGGWNCFPPETGTLDCWEGLSAFAAFPRARWTRRIKRSVERGAEFYLERRLHREGGKRYAPWFRFHYPAHYYYDLLVGLEVMTSLGYSDDRRLGPAVSLLKKKRRPDGRWALDAVHPDIAAGDPYQSGPPYEPFPAIPLALEAVDRPSKLITLRALSVLKRVAGSPK